MTVTAGMTFSSNVAPRRILRPKPQPWRCACPDHLLFGEDVAGMQRKRQPGYLAKCNGCGMRRPS